MKRVVKSVAKGCWRLAGPIRRPLARKFDAAVSSCVAGVVQEQIRAAVLPRFDAADHGLALARHEAHVQGVDANLTLDSVVRELGRLQMQIEVLQQLLLDRQEAGAEGLSLVGEDDLEGPHASGRARVG